VEKVEALLSFYQPSVIVLENCAAKSSRRRLRIRRLLTQIKKLAESKRTRVEQLSPDDVREVFEGSGATNKDHIAVEVAKRLPELAHRLPPPRLIWMSERYSMSIFDAAAFALTFYQIKNPRKAAA
jgi:DNA phosphorothioation-dependent restriction protein DptG